MPSINTGHLAPNITPADHLLAVPQIDAPPVPEDIALGHAFQAGAGHGLLYLGSTVIGRALPPAWGWWRDFAVHYVTTLCTTATDGDIAVAGPDARVIGRLIDDAPPMMGVEYLTPQVLATLWGEIDDALRQELAGTGDSLQVFLKYLERYSDYDNRLPRGRTYVRNGSVIDLQITAGKVLDGVALGDIFDIEIDTGSELFAALPAARKRTGRQSAARTSRVSTPSTPAKPAASTKSALKGRTAAPKAPAKAIAAAKPSGEARPDAPKAPRSTAAQKSSRHSPAMPQSPQKAKTFR